MHKKHVEFSFIICITWAAYERRTYMKSISVEGTIETRTAWNKSFCRLAQIGNERHFIPSHSLVALYFSECLKTAVTCKFNAFSIENLQNWKSTSHLFAHALLSKVFNTYIYSNLQLKYTHSLNVCWQNFMCAFRNVCVWVLRHAKFEWNELWLIWIYTFLIEWNVAGVVLSANAIRM